MTDGEWLLDQFDVALAIWERNEPASAAYSHVRRAVKGWIDSRVDGPYKGARRERESDNLWFAEIPGTRHDGQTVVCSFWIREKIHTVVCNQINTLNWPV